MVCSSTLVTTQNYLIWHKTHSRQQEKQEQQVSKVHTRSRTSAEGMGSCGQRHAMQAENGCRSP